MKCSISAYWNFVLQIYLLNHEVVRKWRMNPISINPCESGTGVVLDCIVSWSLPSSLLWYLTHEVRRKVTFRYTSIQEQIMNLSLSWSVTKQANKNKATSYTHARTHTYFKLYYWILTASSIDIPMFNVNYIAMHRMQIHAGAISKFCVCTGDGR